MQQKNDVASRVPKSSIEGIGWPAIPERRDAAVLAINFQLEQSQWWGAGHLAAHQLRQAQLVIDHAARTVPFYRERLAEAARLAPGQLGMEAWRRIPVMTRADLQAAGDALLSTEVPPSHGKAETTMTSGSTGQPMTVHRCQVSVLFMQALTLRYHHWHRRDLTAPAVTIRTIAESEDVLKPRAWVPGFRTAPQVSLNIARPIPELFDAVMTADPVYLQSHPSMMEGLVKLSRDTGRKPARLREVRTFGEVLDDRLRRLCREVWGVPVANNYASEEFGIMGLQCPDHEHLHVQSENVLIEVLDDDGRPCAPGSAGRVVATGLNNFRQPLIRYEIGDMAEVGGPCPCGRGLPVLTRVLGRVRNLVTLADGARRHPVFSEDRIMAAAPVRQYQLVQTSLEQIALKLVVDHPLTAEQESALAACFNEGLGQAFQYDISYHDELPRTSRGKFEIFRSELAR